MTPSIPEAREVVRELQSGWSSHCRRAYHHQCQQLRGRLDWARRCLCPCHTAREQAKVARDALKAREVVCGLPFFVGQRVCAAEGAQARWRTGLVRKVSERFVWVVQDGSGPRRHFGSVWTHDCWKAASCEAPALREGEG